MDVLDVMDAAIEHLPFIILFGPCVFLMVYSWLGYLLSRRAGKAIHRLLIPGDPQFQEKLALFEREYARYATIPFGPALWLGWINDESHPPR